MQIFGVEFVPLNVPLRHRLETLAAGVWFVFFIGLIPLGVFGTLYLLLFTQLWPLVCIYLFWIWVIDNQVSEEGGRPNEWIKSWPLFKYVYNYFPITVKAVPEFQLDPKRNYMCCLFPHGGLPVGALTAFQTNACKEVKALFPYHTTYGTTLRPNFFVPILRDYFLALGVCSVTPKSINWFLSYPHGGKIVGITVGGIAESRLGYGGTYRIVLKNRKGFAKLALQNGSAIIPCFSFGQTRNFKEVVFREGSLFQRIHSGIEKATGVQFPVFHGRGLFQYNYGLIPFQHPINIVVGAPIEVSKITEPSQDDIDSLHQMFVQKLTELFETYKYEYEKNPEDCSLIIL